MPTTKKKHGTHSGYSHGCRCQQCKQAHAVYERNAARRRRRIRYGIEEPVERYIDASESREHLKFLASKGVGLGSVSQVVGVYRTNLHKIRSGRTKRITPQLNSKILGVPAIVTHEYGYVNADGVKELVDFLVKNGYTKKQIAEKAGIKSGRVVIKSYMRLCHYKRMDKACRSLIKEIT